MKFTICALFLSLTLTSCVGDKKNTKTKSAPSSSSSSTTSNDGKEIPVATVAPGMPLVAAATAITQSSVVINWTAGVGGAAITNIAYSTKSDLSLSTTVNDATPGKMISGLSANTQYYFQVTVVNSVASKSSTIGSFKTLAPIVSVDTTGKFTFTLASSASTSAGVFTTDGTLVRTLWSTVKYEAGSHTMQWDGKDDYGVNLTNPAAKYEVKVLSNNINYTWAGTVGNTAKNQTGSKKFKGLFNCMRGLAIADGTAYFSTGYSEGNSSMHKLKLSDPQGKITINDARMTLNVDYVATDGKLVYWAGVDSYAASNTMVTATKVVDDSEINFSTGTPYSVTHGVTYKTVISKMDKVNSDITGLAVQKNGSFLFVARAKLNELQIINKVTGALVNKLSLTNARGLSVDTSDNIWIVSSTNTVARYTVNGNGTLSAPTLTLAGIIDPLATQVSTDGSMVVVADAGTSQQLKAYNTSNGASKWVYGTPGGYFNDATVKNDKFAFSSTLGNEVVFIAFEPDGSFWVNDAGNFRVQHFTADLIHKETIMSLGSSYFTNVDKNNITRVFSQGLEFKIDYSVPLTGSTGWKLVKNWRTNLSAPKYDPFTRVVSQVTFSNGKTYGLVVTQPPKVEVVELPATGQLRFTGKVLDSGDFSKDGSRNEVVFQGTGAKILNYPLTGFDNLDTPIWSSTPTVLATIPTLKNSDPLPYSTGLTSTGKVIVFNPSVISGYDSANEPNAYYTGHHLGAINKGGSNFLWKTELATHRNYAGFYPPAGYFDIGNYVNQYAGGVVTVVNRNIITTYHGEFWKNAQTNKFNHYYDNGLALGQFGTTTPENVGEAQPMLAGNALSPQVVEASNGDLYLWHGDESFHSAIHMYKITGLNTVAEETISIPFPSTYAKPAINYLDLMAGLPFDKPLVSGNGWTRFPAADAYGPNRWEEAWSVRSSGMSYDKLKNNDIMVDFVSTEAKSAHVERDLGTNNVVASWKISGEVSFLNTMPNTGGTQQFIDVVDANGKTLATFYHDVSFDNSPYKTKVYAGSKVMAEDLDTLLRRKMNLLQNFEISAVGGSITYKYADLIPVTTSIVDSSGNWKTPKKLRLRFVAKGNGNAAYGMNVAVKDFRFYKDQ